MDRWCGIGVGVLTACISTANRAVTVTNRVTVAGSATSTGQRDIPPSVSQAPGSPASPAPTTGSATVGGSTTTSASASGAGGAGPAYGTPPGVVVKTEPDGFKVTKLRPGQRAPQFIVYSFDGVGWDQKWQSAKADCCGADIHADPTSTLTTPAAAGNRPMTLMQTVPPRDWQGQLFQPLL